ncbi:hypothetical protein FRC17_006700, partial [Serendipita sp. 399]
MAPVLPKYPPSPKQTLDKLVDDISKFIEQKAKPEIALFLDNPEPPAWEPPNIANNTVKAIYHFLNIPTKTDGYPHLLLHRLWDLSRDTTRTKLVESSHVILCNASGTGKTRVLLEHLCRFYGFYFVAAKGTDQVGSSDLEYVIKTLRNYREMKEIDRTQNPEVIATTSASNEAVVAKRMKRILTARWIIFHTFLEQVAARNNGELPEKTKYYWMLFQVLVSHHYDLFVSLVRLMSGTDHETLDPLLEKYMDNARKAASGPDSSVAQRFYYFLDEVQSAGTELNTYFSNEKGEIERPILRPIIGALNSYCDLRISIAVSGTGFNLNELTAVLASGTSKETPEAKWFHQHDIGDFFREDEQGKYLDQYFPSRFLRSAPGNAFKKRAFEWLRGRQVVQKLRSVSLTIAYCRYRFTARVIEEVLMGPWNEQGPASPHRVLNEYIIAMSNHTPKDSSSSLANSEPELSKSIRVHNFQWQKIANDNALVNGLALAVYQGLLRGQDAKVQDDIAAKIVEYGVRAKDAIAAVNANYDDEDREKQAVFIQEPLTLVSIIRWLEGQGKTMEAHLQANLHFEKGTGFEGVILLALTRLLRGEKLENVFTFHGSTPDWAKIPATLVAKRSGNYEDAGMLRDDLLFDANGLVTYTRGPIDVQKWLAEGGGTWCLPSNMMGPDLLTHVKLEDGRILLLVIQSKCHFDGNQTTITAAQTSSAIKSLIPADYFHPKLCNDRRKQEIRAMLGALPTGSLKENQYDILRVIAAYPLDASFESPSEY